MSCVKFYILKCGWMNCTVCIRMCLCLFVCMCMCICVCAFCLRFLSEPFFYIPHLNVPELFLSLSIKQNNATVSLEGGHVLDPNQVWIDCRVNHIFEQLNVWQPMFLNLYTVDVYCLATCPAFYADGLSILLYVHDVSKSDTFS